MIFYAWNNPAPHTFVVITDDRDIAYALAMLEMKNYRIVLISPAGSHPDLTSQATVQLDWSRTVLGTNRGVNHERDALPSRVRSPATARPSSSTTLRGSTTFSDHRKPLTREWNDLPSKERRSVFFKSNDLNFDVFGNDDLHSVFMASPKTMGSLGLGDGPLFPRPKSSHTGSPGSANVPNSKSPGTPSFTAKSDSKEDRACLHKGKGRVPALQPEEREVQRTLPSRDQLSHETFETPNDIVRPSHLEETPSMSEGGLTRKNSGSTVVSCPESQESKFSFISVPAPVPTKEDDGPPDKTDAVKQESQSIAPRHLPGDIYSGAMRDAGPSQSKTFTIDATPALAPSLPTTFRLVTPPRIFSPAKPVSLPEKWAPLVKFLRKSGGIARTRKLIRKFLKAFPHATSIAGCDEGVYINLAIKEGVVERTIQTEKGVHCEAIRLTEKYALLCPQQPRTCYER